MSHSEESTQQYTQHRITNRTTKYAGESGEHGMMPEQVATEHVPATYEKDADPLVRLKEGMKKIVGRKTRGIGPKHSRAKPSAITGKKHAEETAKDMANLVDALHVGVNVPGPQLVHTKDGALRRVEQHSNSPLDTYEKDSRNVHDTEMAPQHRRTGATDLDHDRQQIIDTRPTEQLSLEEKLLARKPLHSDLDLVNAKAELKHIGAPSAGLTEGMKAAFLQDRSMRGKGTPGKGIPMEGRETVDETFSGLRHVKLNDGLSEAIKAAYLEDQRERVEMGKEKFERERQDRSHEGAVEVKGMGTKILEGIQTVALTAAHTATQGFHTATEMIMGSKAETHESGAHEKETGVKAQETTH